MSEELSEQSPSPAAERPPEVAPGTQAPRSTPQQEPALERIRRGLYTLAFAALPIAGMALVAGRLGGILLYVENNQLELYQILAVWAPWVAGTALIILAGAGKDPSVLPRALLSTLGIVVLILGGF